MYVRTVVPFAQVVPGGELHVVSVKGKLQTPPEHEPAEYVRTADALAHTGAGGVEQFTPWHGSGLHAPFAQPNWQPVSVGA